MARLPNEPAQRIERPGNAPIQAPAVSQGNVLPAQLTNGNRRQHLAKRNNDLGGAIPAVAASAGTGIALATALPALGMTAAAFPIALPAVAAIGAALVTLPFVYNKARVWNADRKIKQHEKKFEALSRMNQNDPNVQNKLQYEQDKLGMWQQHWSKITGKPYPHPIGISTRQAAGQAPLPQGLNLPGQQPQQGQEQQGLLPSNLIQPQGGQPGQAGGYNQGAPEGTWFSGTPAYNEQVPLLSRNQQNYQDETIQQLRQNPADFGAIRNEELRRFHEETAPQIAEQYFGRNPNSFSGAYPEALGRGGASLGSKLAAMQSQFEAEREGRRQTVALQPSFAPVQHGREAGFGENALNSFAGQAGKAITEGVGRWIGNRFNQSQDAPASGETKTIQSPYQKAIDSVNTSTYQQPQLSQFQGPYSPGAYSDPNGIQKILMQNAEAKQYRGGGRSR